MYPLCMFSWCIYALCICLRPLILMHVWCIYLHMIHDIWSLIIDPCVYDACKYDACIYDPWYLILYVWCMYVWYISMWSSILDPDTCMYDAYICDTAEISSRTDGRTNKPILGVGWFQESFIQHVVHIQRFFSYCVFSSHSRMIYSQF